MGVLVWDEPDKRIYETGLDRGVFYPMIDDGQGVVWNGLISVDESVSGGGLTSYYYDGIKYLDLLSSEDFQATITALSAPDEFYRCDGRVTLAQGLFATQQPRVPFFFSYRTLINSSVSERLGYLIHLVYNATASPASRSRKTLSDTPEPENIAWTIDTVPMPATTYKPSAHLVIDSTKTDSDKLLVLENHLYGWRQHPEDPPDEVTVGDLYPSMPTPAEVITYLSPSA